MFMRNLKKIFTKKDKQNKNKYKTAQQVSFKDLSGNEIILEIKVNGNDTMLVLKDKEDKLEFSLDHEKALLLGILLQSYNSYDVFPDLDNTDITKD